MSRPDARPAAAFPVASHDHTHCSVATVERARHLFEAKGLKLTTLRLQVLEVIASSHEAVGAYDILGRIAASGQRLAPISVYRAIDALLDAGVIHRLESRNAYFACHTQHTAAGPGDTLVLVCEACGRVAEINAAPMFDAISRAVKSADFAPRRAVTEVAGTCRECRAA